METETEETTHQECRISLLAELVFRPEAAVEVEVADLQVDLQVVEAGDSQEDSQAVVSPEHTATLREEWVYHTCQLITNNPIFGHQSWRTNIPSRLGTKTSDCGKQLVECQRSFKDPCCANRQEAYYVNSSENVLSRTQTASTQHAP